MKSKLTKMLLLGIAILSLSGIGKALGAEGDEVVVKGIGKLTEGQVVGKKVER